MQRIPTELIAKISGRIYEWLVSGDFEAIEAVGNGEGLNAEAMRNALETLGRTIRPDRAKRRQYTIKRSGGRRCLTLTEELWTVEAEMPDLLVHYSLPANEPDFELVNIDGFELKCKSKF